MNFRRFSVLTLCCWAFSWLPDAAAHKVASASLILYLNTEEERNFTVSTQMEVESSGDPALDDEIGPEQAARTFVENQLMVLIDEKEQPHNLTTELVNETDEDTPEELRRLSVLVTWDGELPADGKEIALFLKETSEMSIVIATVKNGNPGRRLQVMFAGEYSRSENIEPIMKGDPFDKENSGKAAPETEEKKALEPIIAEPEKNWKTAIRAGAKASRIYTWLPLCLMISFIILKASFRALLLPVLLFLIAQSIGISLAASGLIPRFPWALQVCIVVLLILSLDNLFSFKFRLWRYVAGIAGGFFLGNVVSQSGSLLRLGGSPTEPESLIFFQCGYNLVNLALVLLFGLIITLFSRYSMFRNAFVIPVSIVTAGLAVFLYLQTKPVEAEAPEPAEGGVCQVQSGSVPGTV